MKVLEFKLTGDTAFFKIPEVNTYRYLTYSSIHKISLLGILGSIAGLKGYGLNQDNKYPEFYERLMEVKCSISIEDPKNIKKKYQSFNNSAGYASYEKGNNLIVTEQWLEKPCWTIRLLVDSIPEDLPIVDNLINKKTIYIPYLGKNDHFANIYGVKLVEMEEVQELSGRIEMDGLYLTELFTVFSKRSLQKIYKFSENLPIKLDEQFNQYIKADFSQTNGVLQLKEDRSIPEGAIFTKDNMYFYFV